MAARSRRTTNRRKHGRWPTDNIKFRPQHKIETLHNQENHSADTEAQRDDFEIDNEHACVALEAVTGYDGAADFNDALKQHSEEAKTKKMESLMGDSDALLTAGVLGSGKIANSAKARTYSTDTYLHGSLNNCECSGLSKSCIELATARPDFIKNLRGVKKLVKLKKERQKRIKKRKPPR